MKLNLKTEISKIDKKLIKKIKMLLLILFIMAGVLIYEILLSHINPLWILLGLSIGFIIGAIIGRIISVQWHEEDSKVIGRLDLLGGIILVIYIILSISRHWLFAHWFTGPALTAFTVSFINGVMLGRLFNLRFHIKRVLIEQSEKDNN